MTNVLLNYIGSKVASYLFSKLELYASALFFAEQLGHGYNPTTTLKNIYDFQVFFMPNDNEIVEKEIELFPKNFVSSGIDSWEFID
jgi:hypothetical protein